MHARGQQLRATLAANPTLVQRITPAKLSALVENSPAVAIDLLRAMPASERQPYGVHPPPLARPAAEATPPKPPATD